MVKLYVILLQLVRELLIKFFLEKNSNGLNAPNHEQIHTKKQERRNFKKLARKCENMP